MQIVKEETKEPIKPGVYFISAESDDFKAALQAVQDGYNSPQFAGAKFIQLGFEREVTTNRLTKEIKVVHIVVAVIQFL